MEKTRPVYIVVRQTWGYDDEWWSGDDKPIMAFADLPQAEEYKKRCEAQAAAEDDSSGQDETRFTIVEMAVQA
jgi:hypothetical protein